MKDVSRRLTTVFWGMVILVVTIVVVCEMNDESTGQLAGQAESEFLWTTLMELLTLAAAYLALRLFKFQRIHSDLVARKEKAMKRWGLIRLAILGVPMLMNAVLYYLYMRPTFGYLGIIMALCLPFVYPSMTRCIDETSDETDNQTNDAA